MLWHKTSGRGEAVALIHGFGFTGEVFAPMVEKYQNRFQITQIDLPGHGKSPTVDGTMDAWSEALLALIPQNSTVVGWSLGGLLAMNIATKIPLKKLILVATTPCFIRQSFWPYGILAENFAQFSTAIQNDFDREMRRFIALQTQDKNHQKWLRKTLETPPARESVRQGLAMIENTNLIKTVKKSKTPMRVILGKWDLLVPVAVAKWYRQNRIKTQILETAHLPFLDPAFELEV